MQAQNAHRSLLVLKIALTLTALLLIGQIPFLVTHASVDRVVLGLYSVKYAGLLIVYLLLSAVVAVILWLTLRLTAESYSRLLDRLTPHARWLLIATIALPFAVFAVWLLIDLFFPSVLFGLAFWPALIGTTAAVALAMLVPDAAHPPVLRLLERIRSPRGRWRWVLIAASVLIALLPPLWMAREVIPVGEQAHSNDLYQWIPLITSMVGGDYAWAGFLRDTVHNSQPLPLIGLIQYADAALFHWDIRPLTYAGLALGMIVVLLLVVITARAAPAIPRWLTLPLFSLLMFLPTHLSVYSFSFASVQIPLSALGFLIGVWTLARYGIAWRTITLMLLAAYIASWSGAQGYLAWPVFVMSLAARRDRNPAHYAALIAGGVLCALPFALRGSTPGTGAYSPEIFSTAPLAWAFYHLRDLPMLWRIGGFALLLILLGGLVTLVQRREAAPRLLIAWMCIAYGMGSMVLVLLFRARVLLPWYSMHFVIAWIGVVILALALIDETRRHPTRAFGAAWSAAALALVLIGAFTHRLYDFDYHFLNFRSPVASSCWRHYQTAPDACADLITEGATPDEFRDRASLLEQHRLAMFAPDQRWTMQGDTVIEAVMLPDSAYWALDGAPADPTDYHRLDLVLTPTAVARWQVTIPADATHVTLHTAAAVGDRDLAIFEIAAETADWRITLYNGDARSQRWQPIRISLDNYIGQTVTIAFNAIGTDGGQARYRYPYLDVQFP